MSGMEPLDERPWCGGPPLDKTQPPGIRSFWAVAVSLIPPTVAGLSCLPATYDLSRNDRFLTALGVTVLIGAFGGALPAILSKSAGKVRRLHLAAGFLAGAFVSEVCFFTQYYFEVGYRDPELVLGAIASLLELGAMAIVGCSSTWFGAYLVSVVRQ